MLGLKCGHILNKTFGMIEGSINNTVLQDIEIHIKGIEPYSYKQKVIK